MSLSNDKLNEKLVKNLPVIDWVEKGKPHYRINEKGFFCVNNENGCHLFDYYGEINKGYPWIHPELEAFAKKMGGYWEWQNAGEIIFQEA